MSLIEDIRNLKDKKVWVTRKARIEAEARMNRNHLLSQVLLNYYTFVVVSFSIWDLYTKAGGVISLLIVIFSVALFGVSIFISAMGYREKSIAYKESYISLNELESRLEDLILNLEMAHNDSDAVRREVFTDFKQCKEEYTRILNKTDNHSELDYFKVRIKTHSNLTPSNIFYYYGMKSLNVCFGFILFLIPILGIILIIME